MPRIKVVIVDIQRDAHSELALGVVERVVGQDQAAIDGAAEMGEIKAPECAVPVRAVALTSIELAAGNFQVVGIGIGPGRRGLQAKRNHEHAGVHLVALGIPRLKLRQYPAAQKKGFASSAAGLAARASLAHSYCWCKAGGSTHSVISRYDPSGTYTLPRGSVASTVRASVVGSSQSRLATIMSQNRLSQPFL